ncbi:MAG: hypothetical protein GY751_07100, partial [Bacteroidetes bacterium]|nr:hypothetical protein [Bacteroidota bacterium]
FGGDTEAAEDYIFSMFAGINPAYNDFGAHLYVNYLRLWPNGDDGYTSASLHSLKSEFSRRWGNENNPEYNIERHASVILAHIKDGTVSGWGNVGSVCRKLGDAAVYMFSYTQNRYTLAHELGHVFGSVHTWEYDPPIGTERDPCTIMSYCGSGATEFHPRVTELFRSFRTPENDSCVPLTNPNLDSCSAPVVSVTGISMNEISIVW